MRAQDPRGMVRGLLGMLTQALSYLVPVFLVWRFGGHWSPWIVLTSLLVYVVFSLWVQGYGERRIRAYVEDGGLAARTGTPPAENAHEEA